MLKKIDKNKLFIISLSVTTAVSLYLGISDLVRISSCISDACIKVHASTFGSLLGIPLGFWAASLFVFVFVVHLAKQNKLAILILSIMLGVELYLTFVQVCLLHALCFPCLCFLLLLSLSLALKINNNITISFLTSCLFFFISHFIFFFPNAELKPEILQPINNHTKIEIFGSLSCAHCEKALSDLKDICSVYNADLVFRPVSLNLTDKDKTLRWVCRVLFESETSTAKRLAEQILWKNEKEIKFLEGSDRIRVPVILVKTSGKTRLLQGWNNQVEDAVYALLDGDLQFDLDQKIPGNSCTKNNYCKDSDNHPWDLTGSI